MSGAIARLVRLMQSHGVTRVYAKKLSPNDNSKNQIYLGGDFSALNIFPYQAIHTDASVAAGAKHERMKAALSFFWISDDRLYPAPGAQLILYPDYPEVRMSGFLRNCDQAPSEVLRARNEGRVLFLGITRSGDVLGYAVFADHPAAQELHARDGWKKNGIFLEIPPESADAAGDTKAQLLAALRRVYEKGAIPSQKLRADGNIEPYAARNAGGYTLEAELGISPNGYAEPDYLGWEVKQYSVADFVRYHPKTPVTLMTPEPVGGMYRDEGVAAFLRRYGYADKKGRADRFNFGGIYACNRNFHRTTGLRLALEGFDAAGGAIVDAEGGIVLLSRTGDIAARWNFAGLMQHWNRKHAQAAYIPSLSHISPPAYSYGPKITLCEHTDFSRFLKAVAAGVVYYDPAIKIENASGPVPAIKRRSQFRIAHKNLAVLYHRQETVNLKLAAEPEQADIFSGNATT